MSKKQDITEATNRVCDLIPNGHLLAGTLPANFMNEVANKIERLQAAVDEFCSNEGENLEERRKRIQALFDLRSKT